MLELNVQTDEGSVNLQFEHSLRSLSKWESKTRKAFLTSDPKPNTDMLLYYQCMMVTPGADPDLIYALSPKQLDDLSSYINENQTASSVPEETKSRYNSEITTSELIYFWMTALKIDWEAQDWHLSRLMMLIQITGYKQQPPKKRNPVEVMSDWRKENERRKKLLGTSG